MGYDKLYLLEEKQMRNNYRGHNTLGAGYLAMSLPFGKLGIHAGVRFEHNDMELISNSRDYEKSESSRHYKTDDVFPSLNTTYKISDQHQVRLSYGRSINRPEFREVSSSVYYDFDLASNVHLLWMAWSEIYVLLRCWTRSTVSRPLQESGCPIS